MFEKPPFVKYPEIPIVDEAPQFDNPVEVFEKLDGNNCQIRNWNGRIFPGSRSNYLDSRLYDDPNKLGELKAWMSHFKKWSLGNGSLYSLPEDHIIFGEWMEGGKVIYPKRLNQKFVMIDVAQLNGNGGIDRFLEYETAVNFCRKHGFEEIVFEEMSNFGPVRPDNFQRIFDKANDPANRVAVGDIEGIVIKDYVSIPQVFGKCLSPGYSEIRASERNPKVRYITPSRIRKAYFSLLEQGAREDEITTQALIHAAATNIAKETGVKTPDLAELRRCVKQYLDLITPKEKRVD